MHKYTLRGEAFAGTATIFFLTSLSLSSLEDSSDSLEESDEELTAAFFCTVGKLVRGDKQMSREREDSLGGSESELESDESAVFFLELPMALAFASISFIDAGTAGFFLIGSAFFEAIFFELLSVFAMTESVEVG